MQQIDLLIIEDDVKIAQIQKIFTEKISGYRVAGIAHSIEEGEEILAVLKPDLVLLDIFFPDGNGLDLLWTIRRKHKDTDIILITAAKEVEYFQEGLRGGVFDYILKPLVFNRFENTLQRYLEHKSQLGTIEQLNQDTVDQVLHEKMNQYAPEQLPKGIDPITLNKVTSLMIGVGKNGISAEEAGKRVGVSRTTSRRYLEYLVAGGTLAADLSYGMQGRPERVYLQKKFTAN